MDAVAQKVKRWKERESLTRIGWQVTFCVAYTWYDETILFVAVKDSYAQYALVG